MALSMALSAVSWGLGAIFSEPAVVFRAAPAFGAEAAIVRDEVQRVIPEVAPAEPAPVIAEVVHVNRQDTPDLAPRAKEVPAEPQPMSPEVAAAWTEGDWAGELDGRPLTMVLEHDGQGQLIAGLRVRGLLKKRRSWRGHAVAYGDGDLRLHLAADNFEITGRIAEVYASGVVLLDGDPVGSWWARRQ